MYQQQVHPDFGYHSDFGYHQQSYYSPPTYLQPDYHNSQYHHEYSGGYNQQSYQISFNQQQGID